MEQPITFSDWWNTIATAMSDAWVKILSFIPNLIGAIAIVIIGLMVAWILKWVIVQVFRAIQLQALLDRVKFTEVLRKMGVKQESPELLGNLVKWITVIVFLIPALQVLGLSSVGDIVQSVLSYLPKTIAAGFLVFVGIVAADIISHAIKATALSIGTATATILASVARYAVYVFVSLMALEQLGVASTLLITLFTGFVGMIAIAGGLAFGLGGKEAASDLIKKVREDFSRK